MTVNVQKIGVMIPVSEEFIADTGWPNRCAMGWPCFVHTRYAWYCGDLADPFEKYIKRLEAQIPIIDRIILESRARADALRGMLR